LEIGKQLQDLRHLALSCYQRQQLPSTSTATTAHIELQLHPRTPRTSSSSSSSSPPRERKSFEQLRERLGECEAALQQHQQKRSFSSPPASFKTPPDQQNRRKEDVPGISPSDEGRVKQQGNQSLSPRRSVNDHHSIVSSWNNYDLQPQGTSKEIEPTQLVVSLLQHSESSTMIQPDLLSPSQNTGYQRHHTHRYDSPTKGDVIMGCDSCDESVSEQTVTVVNEGKVVRNEYQQECASPLSTSSPSTLKLKLRAADEKFYCLQAMCEEELRSVIGNHEDLAERQQALLEDINVQLLEATDTAEHFKQLTAKVTRLVIVQLIFFQICKNCDGFDFV
jgi:hypothetical protein